MSFSFPSLVGIFCKLSKRHKTFYFVIIITLIKHGESENIPKINLFISKPTQKSTVIEAQLNSHVNEEVGLIKYGIRKLCK